MAIKHYGFDAAEIENLKAAHLTDDEINDLNKKRAQEQMEDEDVKSLSNEEFFKKLRNVDSEIDPIDYTEDYDDIEMVNTRTINELKEMLLTDGSNVYTEDGSIKGPNAAFSRLVKLLEHKKNLESKGVKCSDDSNDWY